MPLYRVLERLDKGHRIIEPGEVISLSWLNEQQIDRLIVRGAVSRLQAPPLHILPGWKLRAARLHKLGVTDVEQFLESDNEALAAGMEVKPTTIEAWKKDVWGWLIVKEPQYAG